MVKLDAVFTAADGLSPDFAAKLSTRASQFESSIMVACGGKQLSLDSLICILSMEMYRGVSVSVIAEGTDETEAAEAIRKLLVGEAA